MKKIIITSSGGEVGALAAYMQKIVESGITYVCINKPPAQGITESITVCDFDKIDSEEMKEIAERFSRLGRASSVTAEEMQKIGAAIRDRYTEVKPKETKPTANPHKRNHNNKKFR